MTSQNWVVTFSGLLTFLVKCEVYHGWFGSCSRCSDEAAIVDRFAGGGIMNVDDGEHGLGFFFGEGKKMMMWQYLVA